MHLGEGSHLSAEGRCASSVLQGERAAAGTPGAEASADGFFLCLGFRVFTSRAGGGGGNLMPSIHPGTAAASSHTPVNTEGVPVSEASEQTPGPARELGLLRGPGARAWMAGEGVVCVAGPSGGCCPHRHVGLETLNPCVFLHV